MFISVIGGSRCSQAEDELAEQVGIELATRGVTLVCGENVCGIDPKLERDSNGKVTLAPDMDRRIETYRRYHQGYGEILVQMNVEDTRLGVGEYVLNKHKLNNHQP